jgi:transcriptional regulator with XRE-family HTH domain
MVAHGGEGAPVPFARANGTVVGKGGDALSVDDMGVLPSVRPRPGPPPKDRPRRKGCTMASYRDILRMIRSGSTPRQVAGAFRMRPSQWKRILRGKRFREALATEWELAAVMAEHALGASASQAAGRFEELMESDHPETVRKVALALLQESAKHIGQPSSKPRRAHRAPKWTCPPKGALDSEESAATDDGEGNAEPADTQGH